MKERCFHENSHKYFKGDRAYNRRYLGNNFRRAYADLADVRRHRGRINFSALCSVAVAYKLGGMLYRRSDRGDDEALQDRALFSHSRTYRVADSIWDF